MSSLHAALELAMHEPPRDLRGWVWSLAPFGKRVLVAAAAAIMTPAMEAWRAVLVRAPSFAQAVGDDRELERARDAVAEWLRDPLTAAVDEVVPSLRRFCERVDFVTSELSGDGRLHDHAAELVHCIELAVRAVRWTEDDARRLAAGDAVEEASRIAAGPAYEVGEAVRMYAYRTADASVVERIARACIAVVPLSFATTPSA